MTRMSLFNSPFLLGFDELERALDTIQKNGADGYPPYNIEQLDERAMRITLAIAGFSKDDIEITVEDRQLVIRGRTGDEDGERAYLHRGIAGRQFQRKFVLADGMEVTAANLVNGLLHIDLLRPEPESRVRRIEVGTNAPAA